jgi:hypothetical protein
MRYITVPLQGLLLIILSIIAPILVIFTIPFIKWDKEISTQPQRTLPPPKWLSWFQTPDNRLPGDLAIPEVMSVFQKYGKWVTSWYWMGLRNQVMGLAVWMGEQTSDYAPENVEGLWERTDIYGTVWKYTKTIGKIKFITGYKVYAMLDGTFRSAPTLGLKWAD